jgi:hypothetical protein
MERITGGEARRPLLFVILEKRMIQMIVSSAKRVEFDN